MEKLTVAEQKNIKQWILSCADREVILRMQNNTQVLSFMPNRRYASHQSPETALTFEQKVLAHKAYATTNGLYAQGLMTLLDRGGHERLEDLHYLKQEAQKRWDEARPLFRHRMLIDRALVEAQTGFFNIGGDAFKALQEAPNDFANNDRRHPKDDYGDILESRPPELAKLTFVQFMQLREEALKEAGLWLGKPAKDSPAAPVATEVDTDTKAFVSIKDIKLVLGSVLGEKSPEGKRILAELRGRAVSQRL